MQSLYQRKSLQFQFGILVSKFGKNEPQKADNPLKNQLAQLFHYG